MDVQGHSGGIAFLWKNKDEASLYSFSKNHIDLNVKFNGGQEFRLIDVYGEPDRAKRRETWTLIRNLSALYESPCIIGDINNVVNQNDKKGDWPYPNRLIQGFREVLNDCDLRYMDLTWYQYGWERGEGTSSWVEIRLDKTLANTNFFNDFPETKLTNVEVSTLAHCPLSRYCWNHLLE